MRNETPRAFVGTTTFTVTGMCCEHCRCAVTDAIQRIPGVDTVTVELVSGTSAVTASSPVDRADIAAAVAEAGHHLDS
jgi:copper chaperone CopZ